MSNKPFIKDYLTFSRKDRIGILAFLALVLIIYLLPKFFINKQDKPIVSPDPVVQLAVDTLQQRQEKNKALTSTGFPHAYTYEPSTTASYSANGELFVFDPNTLPLDGWKRLGLNDKTIRTINNYRSKGGHFYKQEDLQKIWGMPNGFYERVKPYVQITPAGKPNFPANKTATSSNYIAEKRERLVIPDINTADTTAFIALPGIGSKLANRLIAFREKLGGFYSIDQVAQTYGLPDSTFQAIKPYLHLNSHTVHKLNINTADKAALQSHPYIKYNLANAIVAYRQQHGDFKSLEELKNIVLIDDATFEKIAPYLSL